MKLLLLAAALLGGCSTLLGIEDVQMRDVDAQGDASSDAWVADGGVDDQHLDAPGDAPGLDSGVDASGDAASVDSGTLDATADATPDAAPDQPPTAMPDSRTVAANTGATTLDVLANDSNTDGGPMMVLAVTQGAHGTATVATGGSAVTYQPATNYEGPDSFTYTLNGGSVATVSITVTAVNITAVARLTSVGVACNGDVCAAASFEAQPTCAGTVCAVGGLVP